MIAPNRKEETFSAHAPLTCEGLPTMNTPKTDPPARDAARDGAAEGEPAVSIDAAVQGALGRKLRESYEEIVKEKVPDKFLQLLDQLKQSERSGKTDES